MRLEGISTQKLYISRSEYGFHLRGKGLERGGEVSYSGQALELLTGKNSAIDSFIFLVVNKRGLHSLRNKYLLGLSYKSCD